MRVAASNYRSDPNGRGYDRSHRRVRLQWLGGYRLKLQNRQLSVRIQPKRKRTRGWHLSRRHQDQQPSCRQRYFPAQISLFAATAKTAATFNQPSRFSAWRLFVSRGLRLFEIAREVYGSTNRGDSARGAFPAFYRGSRIGSTAAQAVVPCYRFNASKIGCG